MIGRRFSVTRHDEEEAVPPGLAAGDGHVDAVADLHCGAQGRPPRELSHRQRDQKGETLKGQSNQIFYCQFCLNHLNPPKPLIKALKYLRFKISPGYSNFMFEKTDSPGFWRIVFSTKGLTPRGVRFSSLKFE